MVLITFLFQSIENDEKHEEAFSEEEWSIASRRVRSLKNDNENWVGFTFDPSSFYHKLAHPLRWPWDNFHFLRDWLLTGNIPSPFSSDPTESEKFQQWSSEMDRWQLLPNLPDDWMWTTVTPENAERACESLKVVQSMDYPPNTDVIGGRDQWMFGSSRDSGVDLYSIRSGSLTHWFFNFYPEHSKIKLYFGGSNHQYPLVIPLGHSKCSTSDSSVRCVSPVRNGDDKSLPFPFLAFFEGRKIDPGRQFTQSAFPDFVPLAHSRPFELDDYQPPSFSFLRNCLDSSGGLTTTTSTYDHSFEEEMKPSSSDWVDVVTFPSANNLTPGAELWTAIITRLHFNHGRCSDLAIFTVRLHFMKGDRSTRWLDMSDWLRENYSDSSQQLGPNAIHIHHASWTPASLPDQGVLNSMYLFLSVHQAPFAKKSDTTELMLLRVDRMAEDGIVKIVKLAQCPSASVQLHRRKLISSNWQFRIVIKYRLCVTSSCVWIVGSYYRLVFVGVYSVSPPGDRIVNLSALFTKFPSIKDFHVLSDRYFLIQEEDFPLFADDLDRHQPLTLCSGIH